MKYFAGLALVILMTSCQKDSGIKMHHLSGRTMGTTYNIKFVAPSDYSTEQLKTDVDDRLKAVNMSMSTYIPTSEISKVNGAKANQGIEISDDFRFVLSHALNLAKDTEGIFDPTIGPLVNLWGFGPNGKRKVPETAKINEAIKVVGYKKISLDGKSLKKNFSKTYIDLSASAKGFGVDAITKLLSSRGLKNNMVEIGGEVRTMGKSLSRSWKIGVETPSTSASEKGILKVIQLEGFALATSGSYRNFFKYGDKVYSHTIDYRTGRPVEHTLLSVSVISTSCMDADAVATALMAMGTEKGFEYAKKNAIKAYFIFRDPTGQKKFAQKATSEFNKVVK